MALPGGTVTFLFTDIEGSTRLWEADADSMGAALARHDVLLRQAVSGAGGVTLKQTGDGCAAAFGTADGAVAAALSVQLAMRAEPWPGGIDLRVRAAIHAGVAECRDGDYFGPALNRVARLMAIAHGGQTLLSAAAHELARDHLPDGAALLPLGTHRLKDLGRPETVYGLVHRDLPGAFPPLRSLSNPQLPNNLPQQASTFVGREREMAEVTKLLARTRLLTLTGTGGCGKTRLMLQVAADRLDGDGDGVWLVDLAPLSSADLVARTTAATFGLREEAGKPIERTLIDHLRHRKLLLLLDNCEHLLEQSARLADAVLRECPDVTLMASSREPLGVPGEFTYRVPSLSLPSPATAGATIDAEAVSQFEAVRLFIDRAAAAQPAFAVTNANAPAVAQLCVHLDGIPLAIELAAARVRSLSVEEINARFEGMLQLLTRGSRSALPRQQTLRALIDWSHDLLDPAEAAVFARLSVFANGWDLEAAERVCSGDGVHEGDVLDLLTSLVDKSLVVAEALAADASATRYRLLVAIRLYAAERLATAGEVETVRERHARFFEAAAHGAEDGLEGPQQGRLLDLLDREHDNLRAAHDWLCAQPATASRAISLSASLWFFWYVRGHFSEGRARLDGALSLVPAPAVPEHRYARALHGAGLLAYAQGDYGAARSFLEPALATRRELGDRKAVASTLNALGLLAKEQGDAPSARALHQECLDIRREIGDMPGVGGSLNNLALVRLEQGEPDAARPIFEEALAILREQGHHSGVATALNNLGRIAFEGGDLQDAETRFTESREIRRSIGDVRGAIMSDQCLAALAVHRGQYEHAFDLFRSCLGRSRELGDRWQEGYALLGMGHVQLERGAADAALAAYRDLVTLRHGMGDLPGVAEGIAGVGRALEALGYTVRAVELLGAADALRARLGLVTGTWERDHEARGLSAAREALGESAYATAWERGRALEPGDAVGLATS